MEKQEMSCTFCSESKDREINDVYQFERNEKYNFDNFKTSYSEELCTEDGVNAPDTTDYVEDGANAPEMPYVEDGEAASDFPFQEDGASPEIDVICEPNVAILEDGACVPESIIEDGRKTENKTDSGEETNVENLSFAVENLPRQPSSTSIEEDGENCVANPLAVPMGNDMPGPVADGRVSSPPETHKPCDCTTSCSCGEENECIDTHSATAQELWSSDFLQDAVDESQSCVESKIQLCPGTFLKVQSLDANESGFLGTGHFVKDAEGAPLMLNTHDESQRRARVDLPQVLDTSPEELHTIEEINSLSSAKSLNPTNTHYVSACKPFITETEVIPSELCGFEAPKSIGMHAETIDNKSELVLPKTIQIIF